MFLLIATKTDRKIDTCKNRQMKAGQAKWFDRKIGKESESLPFTWHAHMHITNTQRAKRSEKHSEEQGIGCIFYDHFSRRSTTFCAAKKEKREGQSEKKESEVHVCV